MMDREGLKRYLGVTGYSLGHVEKDYFQHIVLAALSRDAAASLVFKGGTALQKRGLIARFSEDLDFTLTGEMHADRLKGLSGEALRTRGFLAKVDRELEDERSFSFRLVIQGPLYRNRRGVCTIRLDISRREEVLLPPETRELSPPYPDILPYVIVFMDPREMVAEKVRAILTRTRARDLYDLWKLLEAGTTASLDMVDAKLAIYSIAFERGSFHDRCVLLGKKWENELLSLMESVPSHEGAITAVNEAFG